MNYLAKYSSPLGEITLASDGEHLTGLWFCGQKYYGLTLSKQTEEQENLPIFEVTRNWLDRYFSGKQPAISELPLMPTGTEFRKKVWQLLCEIPYGEVTTYKEIAQKIAAQQHRDSMSAQAVGGAVGHNPISIIIPCHRVIGSDGSLTGYAGGITKKKKLVELENKYSSV